MKTKAIAMLCLLVATQVVATNAYAESSAYSQIVKQRDQVLCRILADREGRFATGLCDEASIMEARIALCSFRRDSASTREEKINQQERIVAELAKNLDRLKSRAQAGTARTEDLLMAEDRWLGARQTLESLRQPETKG